MRLFFDTETSGLTRPELPWDHPSQPNLVQLGAQLFDAKWKRTGRLTVLIKPDGWSIEPAAQEHHGITEQRCARHGIDLIAALAAFKGFVENARVISAHHLEFDRAVIRAAIKRVGGDGLWWQRQAPRMFCTMEASTPVCQLPGEFGHKYPSLEEAHRFFYPEAAYSTTHDAEADTDAAIRVYQALLDRGLVPQEKAS